MEVMGIITLICAVLAVLWWIGIAIGFAKATGEDLKEQNYSGVIIILAIIILCAVVAACQPR